MRRSHLRPRKKGTLRVLKVGGSELVFAGVTDISASRSADTDLVSVVMHGWHI